MTQTIIETVPTGIQYIGTLHNTYLVVQTPTGVVLIDQHAAHERILYEAFSARFEERTSTRLLFPEICTLTAHDITVLRPHLAVLTEAGIVADVLNETQLIIDAVPVYAQKVRIIDVIKDMLASLNECSSTTPNSVHEQIIHSVRASMACKAAVKAGDVLSTEEIAMIMRTMSTADHCMTCPHGRPTTWLLTLSEIERKFKRAI